MSFLHCRSFNHRGFSLIELVVTIAIVTLITAIVMVRYSSFDSSILLNNQAYQLALDIRETQVRAISIQVGEIGSDPFASNFGLYFTVTDPNQYRLFQDREFPGTVGLFEVTESLGEPLTIDPRFTIKEIFAFDGATEISVTNVSVVFSRPNFDAQIASTEVAAPQSVRLVISSVRNPEAEKSVVIYRSGQISVE